MGYLGVGGGDGLLSVSQPSEIGDRPRVHFRFRVFVRILFGHALELDFAGIGEGIFQIKGTGQFGDWNPQAVLTAMIGMAVCSSSSRARFRRISR